MTLTASQFRADFPAFGNRATYSDGDVNFWILVATRMVNNAPRWCEMITLGQELFTAHNLVIEAQNLAASMRGIPPAGNAGPIVSKSVDKVSTAYDAGSAMEDGAGHWNLTIFGRRFIHMARMMGAGPLQV